jgi:hypothetical protein
MDHQTAITRFVDAARNFCTGCESPLSNETASDICLELRSLLAEVYAAALKLPELEFVDFPDPDGPTDEQRRAVWPRLKALPIEFYNMFYVPTELESTPLMGWLYDDLQDIYCDLQEGFWLFNRGYLEGAVWQWRFSFQFHWGHHAANAIYALQGYAGIA